MPPPPATTNTPNSTTRVTPNALPASNIHCGQIITASVTANTSLDCASGPGLIVTGNSITVNLAGNYIDADTGNTNTTGVALVGSHDILENGSIAYWNIGVAVGSSNESRVGTTSDTVSAIGAIANATYGIEDRAISTSLTNDIASANGNSSTTNHSAGIFSYGARNGIYKGDHELNNVMYGLDLDYTSGIQVTSNIADGNFWGIDLYSAGGKVTNSTADFNRNDGMDDWFGNLADGGGNSAKGNGTSLPGGSDTSEQCYNFACF